MIFNFVNLLITFFGVVVKKYTLMLLSLFIGAFLMQGFQCASPEYTTAKLALKNREYTKAEEYFEKELKKNQQNGEAWMFMAETKLYLRKFVEANEAADNAIKYAGKDLKIQMQAVNLKSKLWRDTYSSVINNMNKYFKTKNDSALDIALKYTEIGNQIAPYIYEFLNLEGYLYQLKNDMTNAIRIYEKYYQEILPNIEFAKTKNIYMDMSRNDVLIALGEPLASRGGREPRGDSSIIDIFKIDGKELFIKSAGKNGDFKVKTWRYDPPATMTDIDKMILFDLATDPMVELVQHYYDNKQYEKALNVLNSLLVLKPNNEQINNFMITLYDAMGKKDEATKRMEQLIKSDPKNKSFRLSYGNLLMQLDRYDDAIVQYETALKLDPKYYDALRNLASAYKNKAYVIQKRQIEEAKGDKTKMKPDEYLPYIKKSGENFEKCRNTPRYANDVNILFDLVDIYFVTKQTNKMKQAISELEAMEATVGKDDKENYYLNMLKIFQQRLPDEKKSEFYENKIKNLSK